eukprot:2073410-Rhodomonas_salina.1
MQGRDEDEPFMKIKSKEQIRVSTSTSAAPSDTATDGSVNPPNEIQRVFDYTDDADYGDIFSTLSSGKSNPTCPSLQLYAIRDENL